MKRALPMLELPKVKTQSMAADLTALLDVLFIVLVFLLLSVAVKVNVMEVSLPTVGDNNAPVIEQQPKVISLIYEQNKVKFALNDQPFSTLEHVIAALEHDLNSAPTFIAVDKQVPSEYLVQTLAALSQQNITIANILIEHK